jgi:copper chaperone CopZ
MKTANIKVGGMHCPSCEVLITEALELQGAKVEEISHKTGTMTVSYDEKQTTLEKIKKTISDNGYGVGG